MWRMPQMITLDLMPVSRFARAQPLEHRVDDRRRLQAVARVEHRRVAHLEVAHVLGGASTASS